MYIGLLLLTYQLPYTISQGPVVVHHTGTMVDSDVRDAIRQKKQTLIYPSPCRLYCVNASPSSDFNNAKYDSLCSNKGCFDVEKSVPKESAYRCV